MNQERLLKIILSPHISEKSTNAQKNNECVFKVATNATKHEIKDAVELMFHVKVTDVRVINVHAKKKSFRNIKGTRKRYKKAHVTLAANQKIEMMEMQQK